MPITKVDSIWMNGSLVKWDDAKIHVLSHVVHYGTSWFEGIRCYNTAKGSAVFRLSPHIRRISIGLPTALPGLQDQDLWLRSFHPLNGSR